MITTITKADFLKHNPREAGNIDYNLEKGLRYYIGYEKTAKTVSILWADLAFVKKHFKYNEKTGLDQSGRLNQIRINKACLNLDLPKWAYLNPTKDENGNLVYDRSTGGVSKATRKMWEEDIERGLYRMYKIVD